MLARDKRLRAEQDWARLFRDGLGVAGQLLTLVALSTPGKRRVGFSVGRKVGNAVKRNLVKRRLRSAVLNAWDQLPEADMALIAKPALVEVDFATVEETLRGLSRRLLADKRWRG
ncbi:MAG: ribonuclease P protein component [Armatimonadetes bacterium]|nr:ribonuclease P protein component [Armatimonadota bacterium]